MRKRAVKDVRERTLQTLGSVKKEGRRLFRCENRYSPTALGEDHGGPLQPMEDHCGVEIHTAVHGEPTLE